MRNVAEATSYLRIGLTSFLVIFLAEFGDLTQIATANLVAKFGNPISVGIGSVVALWLVGAIGVWGGKSMLRVIPMRTFTGIAAAILAILATVTLAGAI